MDQFSFVRHLTYFRTFNHGQNRFISNPLRRRALLPFNIILSYGEIVALFLYLGFGVFWFLINRKNEFPDNQQGHQYVFWARIFGDLSNYNIAFLLLPTARNSVWWHVFGLSFERLIVYHRFLGMLLFVLTTTHMTIWWVGWIKTGLFSSYFQLARAFDGTNGFLAWVVQSIMTLFAMSIFRRQFFETFYYSHYLFPLFIAMTLYHEYQYTHHLVWLLIPGLTLYMIDRIIRFRNRFPRTEIINARLSDSEQVVELHIRRYGIKKLTAGQYVFVNIPDISYLQWHPFTIEGWSHPQHHKRTHRTMQDTESVRANGTEGLTPNGDQAVDIPACATQGRRISYKSGQHVYDNNMAQTETMTDFVDFVLGIKVTGNHRSWTHGLASLISSTHTDLSRVRILVDGPYGTSLVHRGYNSVVLIAGGIGVTPMLAIATEIKRELDEEKAAAANVDQAVQLPSHIHFFWSMRDSSMYDLFANRIEDLRSMNTAPPQIEQSTDNRYDSNASYPTSMGVPSLYQGSSRYDSNESYPRPVMVNCQVSITGNIGLNVLKPSGSKTDLQKVTRGPAHKAKTTLEKGLLDDDDAESGRPMSMSECVNEEGDDHGEPEAAFASTSSRARARSHIVHGRHNYRNLLNEVKRTHLKHFPNDRNIRVMVCGPPTLNQKIATLTYELSSPECRFDFTDESFEF